jgi:hypothetical protein
MARNVTLSRGSSYKNGGQQKTDTFLAFKLNEGVKLENVFDTLIGVNPSMEYVEHDGNGAIIGWSLKEAYYNETARAGIVLTASNKDTYFEKNFRGDNSTTSGQSIPTIQKGQPGGVAELNSNGFVPKSQLEIVEIIQATGTTKITDNNTSADVVSNWSSLTNKSTLVDNDRFYIADPAVPNGQNKLASFGDLKTQLKTDLLTGVILKDPLTGLVPTNLIEVVKYDTTDGTVVTSDVNSVTRAVADSTQLAKATVNKANDEFYFKNNTTGKNETITFADLKKELASVCFKLASQNVPANTVVKFPHTFGTKDLASVTVYDSTGDIITNEVNFETKVTATDIEVKSTVAIAGVYVIACGLDNGVGGVVAPPTGATTVVMTATGYKVKTTVNGIVSNEIELPCPIVNYEVLPFVNFGANPQTGFETYNAVINATIPTIPTAPSGYFYAIDYTISFYYQSFYEMEPQTLTFRCMEKNVSPNIRNIQSVTLFEITKLVEFSYTNTASKLITGQNVLKLYPTLFKKVTNNINNYNIIPNFSYKIYLAKATF